MKENNFEINEIIYARRNAADLSLGTPVYRFMSFDALLVILLSGSIPLIKTKYWEDIYENFLFKSPLIVDETPMDFAYNQELLFGSSWTKISESDALWRIYSQNKCGVRIRSTVGKLARCIQKEFEKSKAWFANIGSVEYLPTEDIVAYFEARRGEEFMKLATPLFRDSMFMKRKEFGHEAEIRVILNVKKDACVYDQVAFLPIAPKDVIEEITFDPRISDHLRELFVTKLNFIGYAEIPTNKSSLYGPLSLNIRFKPSQGRLATITGK